MSWLGAGLVAAMMLRLAWLRWRTPQAASAEPAGPSGQAAPLPGPSVWLWAALSAGLPLALPFAARSIASQSGEGALATFNYAWKLVELPLVLAIQLVAALAFPGIARATASGDSASTRIAMRGAFALAWALACAAAAALLVGAPAIARLLFGWGRMEPEALARVAQWGAIGAWGLLPQAVIAVSLAALAARGGMKPAVLAYGLALALLLSYAAWGGSDGARLMVLLNFLQGGRGDRRVCRPRFECPLLVALAVDGDLALVPAGTGGCRGAGPAALPGPVDGLGACSFGGYCGRGGDMVGQRRFARRPGAIIQRSPCLN